MDLKESEELFRTTFEHSPLGMLHLGIEGNWIRVNPKFCEMLGYTERELLETTMQAITHPEDVGLSMNAVRRLVAGEIQNFTQEKRYIRKDGSAIWACITTTLLRSGKGDPGYFITVVQDITDQKVAGEKLQRSEAFLSAILENIPSIVRVKDAVGRFLLVNREWERLCQLKRYEVLGRTEEELNFKKKFPTLEDKFPDADILVTRKVIQNQQSIQFTDGDEKHYVRTKFPVMDRNGDAFAVCAIATDITPQVLAQREVELERARSAFSSKMAALGEMAGGIAHEINTPLAIVHATADQLSELVAEEGFNVELAKEMAQTIVRTAGRIAKIIISMRSFSRNSAKDALDYEPVRRIFENTLALCSESLKSHSIRLDVKVPDTSLMVLCRSNEVSQVLLNLLNNSRDALEEQPAEKRWVKLEAIENGDFVDLAVTDSGSGLSDEVLTQLFKPFFTTKGAEKGTGLGLSISQRIAVDHGGSLLVDRKCPNTRFILRLRRR